MRISRQEIILYRTDFSELMASKGKTIIVPVSKIYDILEMIHKPTESSAGLFGPNSLKLLNHVNGIKVYRKILVSVTTASQ